MCEGVKQKFPGQKCFNLWMSRYALGLDKSCLVLVTKNTVWDMVGFTLEDFMKFLFLNEYVITVGFNDGCIVGSNEGLLLGFEDGLFEGCGLGCAVRTNVGDSEGTSLGIVEGSTVGFADGSFVVSLEGFDEGLLLG